jgi:hypothetical protein
MPEDIGCLTNSLLPPNTSSHNMSSSQLSNLRTAFRDIAIVTTFFAANIALRHYSKKQTFSSRHVSNNSSISSNVEPPRFKKFTSLPVEIREMIYEHAMRQGGHFAKPTYVDRSTGHASHISSRRSNCLPNVCFTSKVENLVATSVFIRNATFHLSQWADAAIMASWLKKRQKNGRAVRSVRRIELSYIPSSWPIGFSPHFELLRRCPGLRELTITIPLRTLDFIQCNDAHVPISRRLLTCMELLKKFELGGILECAQLHCVTFKISSKYTSQFASRLPVYSELKKLVQSDKITFFNRHRRAPKFMIGLSNEQGTTLGDVRELFTRQT